jgi:hypothetical protein
LFLEILKLVRCGSFTNCVRYCFELAKGWKLTVFPSFCILSCIDFFNIPIGDVIGGHLLGLAPFRRILFADLPQQRRIFRAPRHSKSVAQTSGAVMTMHVV